MEACPVQVEIASRDDIIVHSGSRQMLPPLNYWRRSVGDKPPFTASVHEHVHVPPARPFGLVSIDGGAAPQLNDGVAKTSHGEVVVLVDGACGPAVGVLLKIRP